ncbi:MAG: plasmid stabilization system [Candidatus Paceibacterota bacterium]|jgi:mRNA-degrading endonuclease RelE of RelBE toxin-antitoxin system
MNKIEKFLSKIESRKRDIILELLYKIKTDDLRGLDIKKLQDQENCFRLRKGKIRIIYKRDSGYNNIVSVEYRSEKTYRDF